MTRKLQQNMAEIAKELNAGVRTLMVLTAINVGSCISQSKISYQLKNLAEQRVQIGNATGDSRDDKFYDINGQKAYIEIDGKPVEHYFSERKVE